MKKIKFQSRLERLSDEMEYFAIWAPKKVSAGLGVRGAVAILARVNGSKPFRGSLVPTGDGGHLMRVKASVREEVGLAEGDRARVEIEIVDRAKEAAELPVDLVKALKAEGVLDAFKSITPGKRSFLLRGLENAVKPETRAKRVRELVEEAHRKREKV